MYNPIFNPTFNSEEEIRRYFIETQEAESSIKDCLKFVVNTDVPNTYFTISKDNEITFYVNDNIYNTLKLSNAEKIKLIGNLIKTWKTDVLPSLKRGETYTCLPTSKSRAKLYKRFGFVESDCGFYSLHVI